ncbi:hypothetical protein [Bradyrhizobium sp. URHC0002]
MDRTADKEIGCRAIPHRSTGWRRGGTLAVAVFCIAGVFLFASEAGAQCTARDVLQNQLRLKKTPSASAPRIVVRSAAKASVWKTITVGTFANSLTLHNALDAVGCSVGGLAAETLARPAFTLRSAKTSVNLFLVSAAELGFETDTVPLANIYARAQELGFELVEAEVAPQLRLQYFDQPVGEFLIVAMEPITTWKGDPVILNVANGGAGLTLIGQDGSADAQISVVSRFVFARSEKAAPLDGVEEAEALDNR